MVNFIDGIFFFYMFVGLYMLSLFLLIYFPNRHRIFSYEECKEVPVSIVMPCYNEEEYIGEAIESLLKLDWPKDKMEIIIVDDKSKDNSVKIIQKYAKKYPNVRLIVNKVNSGGAAEPTNIGIMAAKYDYIVVADADTTPQPDALRKMIGMLQKDKKVGGVTCAILSKEQKTFMQKLQSIEYVAIAFGRKLLDMVDCVYVTPGPFAVYRKKVLIDVGLFDKKNITQDIEIVWRLLSKGYVARMCLAARVYSNTPEGFKAWWKQRIRWNIGGTQTLWKYKKYFFRNGMLGAFILPFFSSSMFLGLFGLGIFSYLMCRRILVSYLATQYSLYASTTILRMSDLSFAPSILNFFGIAMFFLGASFTLLGLSVMQERRLIKNRNIFNFLFYLIVYLMIYPFIMITALCKLITGKYSW